MSEGSQNKDDMKRDILYEAEREMIFALNALQQELADSETDLQNAENSASVEAQRLTIRWLKKDLDEKLKGIWITLDQKINASLATSTSNLPSPWAKIKGSTLMYSLAQTWDEMKGTEFAYDLVTVWDKLNESNSAEKVNSTWSQFKTKLKQLQEGAPLQELKFLALGLISNLVHSYIDTWTIYCTGWAQRTTQRLPLRGLATATDYIVGHLHTITYRNIEKERLHIPDQFPPIPVFFGNKAYTQTSQTLPMPYIVIPRWASRNLWLGNAIAHEMGHNVLWNIKGLFDELLVTLINKLTFSGFNYDHQRIWGRWLEEIFADLFGLLLIGPAIIRSQQRLFAHIPPDLRKKLDVGLFAEVINGLREAYDTEHPLPYLRVWLNIEAAGMLADYTISSATGEFSRLPRSDQFQREIELLGKDWSSFFKEEGLPALRGLEESKVFSPSGDVVLPGGQRISAIEMLNEGKTVLKILLFTPLNALASLDENPRSLADVFYSNPDYEAIETAIGEISSPDWDQNRLRDFDIRVILAAAEYTFEQAKEEELPELSNRLVTVLSQFKSPYSLVG